MAKIKNISFGNVPILMFLFYIRGSKENGFLFENLKALVSCDAKLYAIGYIYNIEL